MLLVLARWKLTDYRQESLLALLGPHSRRSRREAVWLLSVQWPPYGGSPRFLL